MIDRLPSGDHETLKDGCFTTALGCDEPLEGNYFISAYPPFSTWSAGGVAEVSRALANPSVSQPETPLGLYVHIPFCEERCQYCYYLSYANKSAEQIDEYVNAVIEELELYRQTPALSDRDLSFVYFGGGTPSLLSAPTLARLMDRMRSIFPWTSAQEVSFECAPKSVNEDKLRLLQECGVTRLSMGVQSLDDEILQLNGRIHLARDVEHAFASARKVGFPVINIDLIVGLVGESEASFLGTVDRVIAWRPESVTIYQLEIPRNTPLHRALASEEVADPLVSWEEKRRRLGLAFDRIEAAGYHVRSAYNAVRDPDCHGFVYQDAQYHGADLLGVGLASFSYIDGVHFQNATSNRTYQELIRKGTHPIERAYALTKTERLIREFVLQLKLGRVDRSHFQAKFGIDVTARFTEELNDLQRQGLLSCDADGVTLSRTGLLRVDRILPCFFRDCHRNVRYS